MRQWLIRGLSVLLLVPGLGLMALDHASAAQCRWVSVPRVDPVGGGIVYKMKQVCPAGVRPGSPPVSGKGAPACDIKSAAPATFCWGSDPCYYKDVVAPFAPPATPPPTPGADWHVRICYLQVLPGRFSWQGTAAWVGQARQPPMADQAREAMGRIVLPTSTLSFNPTARTLVNLDTWFWAQGLTAKVLRGSSALGLVAYATPDRLEITPGERPAKRNCPWATVKSDRCSYPYRRSSAVGSARGPNGAPAYRASAHAVWKVRFELNSAPVVIPGAPVELTGPEMTAPVVVAEVQTIVTGTG